MILGLFTRWVAIPLTIDMLMAILLVRLLNALFCTNGGYEFSLMLLFANVSLMLAGALAIDDALAGGGGMTSAPAVGLGSRGS